MGLSVATQATILKATGTGTIRNDDGVTIVNVAPVSVLESATTLTFTLTLSNPAPAALSVDYHTVDVSWIAR